MEQLKVLFSEYEKVIINLSCDTELQSNLKKYDSFKNLLTNEIYTHMTKTKNYQIKFIHMLNKLFKFDNDDVTEIFKYI